MRQNINFSKVKNNDEQHLFLWIEKVCMIDGLYKNNKIESDLFIRLSINLHRKIKTKTYINNKNKLNNKNF